jgi:hypothetical protein
MGNGDHHSSEHGHEAGESQRTSEYTDHSRHALPGGLSIAAEGLRLVPAEIRFTPGTEHTWIYQIRDYNGNIVTDFEETHDKLSHLIVVRRDLTRFQHLHPEMASDGSWSQQFTLPDPGVYRAFADILIDGNPMTLGVDLFAPGSVELGPRPDSTRKATADGYDVTLRSKEIHVGKDIILEFEVQQDGERVNQLDQYLGALGHLVALREGDLAYLHVHPEKTDPMSGIVRFKASFPTAGRYRLFLQSKPNGDLITTSFDIRLNDSNS